MERAEIKLSCQTMSNWLMLASENWLKPIYDELHGELVKRSVLRADETTQGRRESGNEQELHVSVPDKWRCGTSGRSLRLPAEPKTGERESVPRWVPWRLHAYGYQGYHKLPEQIRIVGCWVHAGRKIDEALNTLPVDKHNGSAATEGVAW